MYSAVAEEMPQQRSSLLLHLQLNRPDKHLTMAADLKAVLGLRTRRSREASLQRGMTTSLPAERCKLMCGTLLFSSWMSQPSGIMILRVSVHPDSLGTDVHDDGL